MAVGAAHVFLFFRIDGVLDRTAQDAGADRLGGEKEVEYINTHGTSTPVGDVAELGAIKRLFERKG